LSVAGGVARRVTRQGGALVAGGVARRWEPQANSDEKLGAARMRTLLLACRPMVREEEGQGGED